MFDALGVEAKTGWRVVARRVLASTNDAAAALAEAGPVDRVVVVADQQTEGRGRGGSRFVSPPGGLYASLLLRVPSDGLPALLVAAVGVALADAVEALVASEVRIKWPNDLWVGGKKAAGILVETAGSPDRGSPDRPATVPVVVGIGVNLTAIPEGLPPDVVEGTTALDAHAATPVSRERLLLELLPRVDRRIGGLTDPSARLALEADFRARMALLGERVCCLVGDSVRRGVLRDVSLDRGLEIEDAGGARSWLPMAHARELRRDGP